MFHALAPAGDRTSTHSGARRRLLIVAVILGLAATLLLLPLGNDYRARWYGETTDAAHVVLFSLLTWALAVYGWPRQRWKAATLAATVAVAAEAIQPLIGRSASWRDLAYGMLGIGMAVVWLSARSRWLRAAAILALAIWPASETGPLLVDAFRAWRSFPVLARFDSPLESRRWYFQHVRVVSTQPGTAVLEFAPSDHGSGAILLPVIRDWSDYRTLEIDFALEGEPMVFLISVRDGKKLPPELPRYDLWRRYEPGEHRVRIDLAELARGGDFPPIELHRVQSLHLVAYSDSPQTIALKRIELTGYKTGASGQ